MLQQIKNALDDSAQARSMEMFLETAFCEVTGIHLTAPQLFVIYAIQALPGAATVGDVARYLGCSRGNLTGLSDRLVEAGMVIRDRDGADRREVFLRLTDRVPAVLRFPLPDETPNETEATA